MSNCRSLDPPEEVELIVTVFVVSSPIVVVAVAVVIAPVAYVVFAAVVLVVVVASPNAVDALKTRLHKVMKSEL